MNVCLALEMFASHKSMVKCVCMCNYFNKLNVLLFDTHDSCLLDEVNPLML